MTCDPRHVLSQHNDERQLPDGRWIRTLETSFIDRHGERDSITDDVGEPYEKAAGPD